MSAALELARLAFSALTTEDRAALLLELKAGPTAPLSLRLLRMKNAAAETGLSRSTLWRAIREGRLQAIEVRAGSWRIPEAELQRFVSGRAK